MYIEFIYNKVSNSIQLLLFLTMLSCNSNKNSNEHKILKPHLAGISESEQYKLERKLITDKTNLLLEIEKTHKKKIDRIIKGTTGGATLYEVLWVLHLILKENFNDNTIKKYLLQVKQILKDVEITRKIHKDNDVWKADLDEIDPYILFNKNIEATKDEKKDKLKELFKNLKKKTNKNHHSILSDIHHSFKNLELLRGKNPPEPKSTTSFLYNVKANIMLAIWVKRGIITVDPHWWKMSDLFLSDEGGVNAYRIGKNIYNKPLVPINVVNKKIYVVTDLNFRKQILSQSPKIFGPGKPKILMFKNFMEKNVGIAEYDDWKHRRKINEEVLYLDKLHKYSHLYNKYIYEAIMQDRPTDSDGFIKAGKKIISRIVFNDKKGIPEEVFKTFVSANSVKAMRDPSYKIKRKIYNVFEKYMKNNVQSPKNHSLVEMAIYETSVNYCPNNEMGNKDCYSSYNKCPFIKKMFCPDHKKKICNCNKSRIRRKMKCLDHEKKLCSCFKPKRTYLGQKCEEEVLGQIPHWIFPIMKLIENTVPRAMLILSKHPKKLAILISKIKKINTNNSEQIYNLTYLRNCILETLRLNNTNTALLRTLKQDYTFDARGKYSFKKGTQFITINNPVTREPQKFENPDSFIPERWNKDLESSYYSIMFNQGPQRCPGKELALFIAQSFIVHYIKACNYKLVGNFNKPIDKTNIKQMINPFKITFS